MTFSNLRLILSPTLRLSPVMLSLLVNEREQVFPKPGTFLAAYRDSGAALQSMNFNSSNLDLSLPLLPAMRREQPKLTLSLPGEDGSPPIPPSKSPIVRQGASSSTPPTVNFRTAFSSNDSSWTSFSSPVSGQSSARRSNGSIPGYRASWHVVDLPPTGVSGGRKISSESRDSDDEDGHSNTPIARKFLNQRNSVGNLLEKAGSASPAPSESSRRSVSSNGTGSNVLARTPTLTGRSPSPFFSSGAPPAALGFMAGHSRKRSSASSFSSIVSNSIGADGRPLWRSRKVSPQHDAASSVVTKGASGSIDGHNQHQDEEEELSNSDTNTSICSSASSAKTPSDQHDLPLNHDDEIIIAGSDANNTNDEAEEGDSVGPTLDSRRATITAESFGQSFARRGQGKNANSEEMRRKRGSVMISNMPKFD